MSKNYDGYLMWAVKDEDKIYHPLFQTREEARQFCRASSCKWEIVKVKLVEVKP